MAGSADGAEKSQEQRITQKLTTEGGRARNAEEPDEQPAAPADSTAGFSAATKAAMDGEEKKEAVKPAKRGRTEKEEPQTVECPTAPRSYLTIDVFAKFGDDGEVSPEVRVNYNLSGDLEEDEVVRAAELAVAATEAAMNRIVEDND